MDAYGRGGGQADADVHTENTQNPKNFRERGLFLDGMWTSTRRGGQAHVDACVEGEGVVKTRFSCGRHKWMAPISRFTLLNTELRISHNSSVET